MQKQKLCQVPFVEIRTLMIFLEERYANSLHHKGNLGILIIRFTIILILLMNKPSKIITSQDNFFLFLINIPWLHLRQLIFLD